jgi:hypothetical protein
MSIKEQGSGFVSDDMVIIDPEGRALVYPEAVDDLLRTRCTR